MYLVAISKTWRQWILPLFKIKYIEYRFDWLNTKHVIYCNTSTTIHIMHSHQDCFIWTLYFKKHKNKFALSITSRFWNCTADGLAVWKTRVTTATVSAQEVLKPPIVMCSDHDDVIKWKHFTRYWPFARGIHRSPMNSPHKGQWRGAFMFPLICIGIFYGWINNREAGDLRRNCAHCDVSVMWKIYYHCHEDYGNLPGQVKAVLARFATTFASPSSSGPCINIKIVFRIKSFLLER